jgi:hypothetical protein
MGIAFGFREIAANTTAFSAPRLVDLALSADCWKSAFRGRAVRVYVHGNVISADEGAGLPRQSSSGQRVLLRRLVSRWRIRSS